MDGNGRTGKVQRLIERYGIPELGRTLGRRRRGDDGDPASLRELADLFNRRLLAARLSGPGEGLLDGEARNLYRLLTDDDVSVADRTRARGRLADHGIDADELDTEFVSREAIRTYLDDHGVSPPQADGTDQVEREQTRIRQLRSRTATVTESKLRQLRSTGRVSVGSFRVLVDVQLYCEDCNTQLEVDRFLERRACDCAKP